MKNYLFPVTVVTGYLLVYVVSIGLELHTRLILFMFSMSPALILWMAYKVLKANVLVEHTFEERWYEDFEEGRGRDEGRRDVETERLRD